MYDHHVRSPLVRDHLQEASTFPKQKNFPSQNNIVQTYGKRSLPVLGAYGFIFFNYL